MKKLFYLLFIFAAFALLGFQTTDNDELKCFLTHKEFLLKDGGKWQTVNKNFDAADEWSDSLWGYQFEKGINNNTFKLKITGYVPKHKKTQTYWEGIYTWDPVIKKAIYLSTNPWGGIAQGETEKIDNQILIMVFTIKKSDETLTKHRDVHAIDGETIKSKSYDWKNNRWELNDESVWIRTK